MNNQQQPNLYGNQQQQHQDQWNQLLQWQQWQNTFQQPPYQQPYVPLPAVVDQSSQFAAPPPPPPETNDHHHHPSTSSSTPPSAGRNTNPKSNKFNQSSNASNRGQNSNKPNWRGNQRNRGNTRSNGNDASSFNSAQNQAYQHNSGNNDGNFQFNESNTQRQGNFGSNNNNRGRNQRNNWRSGRKNAGGSQQESNTKNLSFAHSVPPQYNNAPSLMLEDQFRSRQYNNAAPPPPLPTPNEPFQVPKHSNAPPVEAEHQFQTPEDLAFEEEFKKWETQFQEWKNQNRNHPDQRQYQTYEKQFLEVREKLLSRREEMRRKKLQTGSTANPVKTAEQIAFETQWNNEPKVPNDKLSKPPPPIEPPIFDPKPSCSQLPPPETSQSRDMAVSAAEILFGNKSFSQNYESFEKDDDFDQFSSFDDNQTNRPSAFADSKNCSIPGLEIAPTSDIVEQETKEKENLDVIDLDLDEEAELPEYEQAPQKELKTTDIHTEFYPLARFRPRVQRNMIDIEDILNEPRRSVRPEKIMVLIRGAPGSGKHYLANLIFEKEREMANERCRILSIDRYVVGAYDSNQADSYNQALFAECRNLVREGYINFVLVILNGCTIQQFNKISHTAISLGGYHCYSIEIHQKREICESHNVNKRSLMDIINGIEDLDRYPTPHKVAVIDPTSLLKSINGEDNNSSSQPPPSLPPALPGSVQKDESNVNDFAQKMATILQDRKVIEILQAQLNNTSQQPQAPPSMLTQAYQPPPNLFRPPETMDDRFYQAPSVVEAPVPVFIPAKVIDYNHEHILTFEEKLMEFKIFRVVDYNHREKPSMRDFLRDIDLDKIIEKRKAVALRKKILEYLRSAERPEDTVSNPKYPKNWEVIQQDRPPRRNKRKKTKTAKIKRILVQKSREEHSWMTRGYKVAVCQDDAMELEEISSEDEENRDPDDTPNKVRIVDSPPVPAKPAQEDEFKDVFKTIPDFNHFNHPNVMDIRKLLWLPDRRKRPNKICIILRGPNGSGKSHLVQLIKRKENEMEKDEAIIRILSIDDYFLPEDDEDLTPETQSELAKSYLEEMQKHLKKTLNEGLYNFIIIDAENCDLTTYNQFFQIGLSRNFAVYTIELYQTVDICTKQYIHHRPPNDIEQALELLSQNRIPKDHVLLNPSALYAEYDCFVNPAISSNTTIGTYRKYLEQLIEDRLLSCMPNFNFHSRDIMNIAEILDDPGRYQRSENIAILLRGPCESGKEELAKMIIEKEKQYGNQSAKYISVSEVRSVNRNSLTFAYSVRSQDDKLERLLKTLRDVLRVKTDKLLIIDAETGVFLNYMQMHELVSSYHYKCYTIELCHDAAICQEKDANQTPLDAYESILDEMRLNPTPDDHVLLNAAMFYKQTTISSDRPLKSALKISPNTSFNTNVPDHLQEAYERALAKLDNQSRYQALFSQRIKIKGEFIRRNEKPPSKLPEFNWFNQDIKDIRDILDEPNRLTRAENIAIFIRGAHGSGKTYLARLIERRELEKGGSKRFKLLSVDEFFETDQYGQVDSNQGEKYIEVNLDSAKANQYMEQYKNKFKTHIESNEPSFIVVDGYFCDLKYYNQMWNMARQNNFTCYAIELNQDNDICLSYNYHGWEPSVVLKSNEMMLSSQTPSNHSLLDPEVLYHDYHYEINSKGFLFPIDENMDTSDVSDVEDIFESAGKEKEEDGDDDDDAAFETKFGRFKMSNAVASKWDDVETPDINRLDGTMKKSEKVTMKDYLQSDEWSMRPSTSGKKRVRWADIEEKKAQERMRSIGFIVGMTDWNRMTDESDGRSALEKTKYIEPRKKN